MNVALETPKKISKVETLETEVKKFADGLPYWAKYLAEKIYTGKIISDNDIDSAYSFLLQDLKLSTGDERPEIIIKYSSENTGIYKSDLLFGKLLNVEGVNALTENQTIEFNPNLTLIYGSNGSGKSGYIRLLKKAFYSKSPEDILPNVHITSGHKAISAKFTFNSNKTDFTLDYPAKGNSAEFKQFAVFDGKSVLKHLAEKNEFEFRPAGLSFFAYFTDAILKVENKLNSDIALKKAGFTIKDFSDLFVSESEIKSFIEHLSATTKTEDLNKFTPFSDEDKAKFENTKKQYDELLLASKGKEKEINNLKNIKKLLGDNKKAVETLNGFFTIEYIDGINALITDCLNKEDIAKNEGIDKFKTDKITGIGTVEWKNFIVAAENFAKKQKPTGSFYPEKEDNCLLCQQPLSTESEILITNYWKFIKSIAEEEAKKAQDKLNNIKSDYEKINFNLYSNENTLTVWLSEKYSKELEQLKGLISSQKIAAEKIISNIQNKLQIPKEEIKIDINIHSNIEKVIDSSIEMLVNDEQSKELDRLLKEKTYFEHKEKYNIHFSKFDDYVKKQAWVMKAEKANFGKRKITDSEKALSDKYFNQKYITTFSAECKKLNGSFDISINHTGSAGKTYRQLKLKGKSPNAVLSEGEQKVIAIADFITEMQLSEINQGIIFDDPVTSLDEKRKSEIAARLVEEAISKQVIIFTHDLVFVSCLLGHSDDRKVSYCCHWIENRDDKPGQIWLNNAPSYEKEYRNAEPAKKYYNLCSKAECQPMDREQLLKQGFTALRTCYEVLVINDLFNNVVQRYNERVSIDALSKVTFTEELKADLLDSFSQCCRYMEGHSHSDKYSYKKPEPKNLNEEILRYEVIRKKIKDFKK